MRRWCHFNSCSELRWCLASDGCYVGQQERAFHLFCCSFLFTLGFSLESFNLSTLNQSFHNLISLLFPARAGEANVNSHYKGTTNQQRNKEGQKWGVADLPKKGPWRSNKGRVAPDTSVQYKNKDGNAGGGGSA